MLHAKSTRGAMRIELVLSVLCCLAASAWSRSLLDTSKLPDRASSCGELKCPEGKRCIEREGKQCWKRSSGYKTRCSAEKVCLKDSTQCGDTYCKPTEKCALSAACKVDFQGLKEAVKDEEKRKALSGSHGPECFTCQPNRACQPKTVQVCKEDKSDCEEVPCTDFDEQCDTVTKDVCNDVVIPVCVVEQREECFTVETDVCVNVPTEVCKPVVTKECQTVTKTVCPACEAPLCSCETVKVRKGCKKKPGCEPYQETICKKSPQGKEECKQQLSENCDVDCEEAEEERCECEDPPECECSDEEEEECQPVEKESCTTEEKEECKKEPKEVCEQVDFQKCTDKTESVCEKVETEECKEVPAENCAEKKKVCKVNCKDVTTSCEETSGEGETCGSTVCQVGEKCGFKCELIKDDTKICSIATRAFCITDHTDHP